MVEINEKHFKYVEIKSNYFLSVSMQFNDGFVKDNFLKKYLTNPIFGAILIHSESDFK